MLINHTSKQVTAKIVYYGPGLGGKTTNLKYIFSVTNPHSRGELVSMETEIERTLFFDLLPINVGLVKGYHTKFQLYTVPGQVFYDSTRKLVLKGADGIVFVADSQDLMDQANKESYENLKDNLEFHNNKITEIPLVFQYNKRDLKNIVPLDKINGQLNHLQRPYFEAVARSGRGVIETLREIAALTLVKVKQSLEHQTVSPLNIAVNFDVDKSHPMLTMEELHLKKISVEKMSASEPGQAEAVKTEAVAQAAPVEKAAVKSDESKKGQQIKKSFGELLNKYDDPTRITKIEKIAVADGRLTVEIRDGSGEMIRSFNIDIHPETKKINIILDVKS